MNPANQAQAGAQVRYLLTTPRVIKNQRYLKASTRKVYLRTAENIARIIWCRWHVGIYRWREKHLRWYLVVHLAEHNPGTCYQHWLVLCRVCEGIGREALLIRLKGAWQRPD